jgi:hypothetical protein
MATPTRFSRANTAAVSLPTVSSIGNADRDSELVEVNLDSELACTVLLLAAKTGSLLAWIVLSPGPLLAPGDGCIEGGGGAGDESCMQGRRMACKG